MPQPDPKASRSKAEPEVLPDNPAPIQPPPEPWTPARVLEWNRYYDLYIAGAVLLLIFIASVNPVANLGFWSNLQTGRLIAQNGPITRDPFSYTNQGKPWVNIPWLFQLVTSKIFDTALQLRGSTADQFAAGLLVAAAALVRVLTGGFLLGIRRRGPGLWWVACTTALALGAIIRPLPGGSTTFLPTLGGIAHPPIVEPATLGLLFLAIELWLLHRAFSRGCRKTLLILVPLFIAWANTDASFLIGLFFLAMYSIGSLFPGKLKETAIECAPVSPPWAFGVLALCALGCLLNPSLTAIYPEALRPFTEMFGSTGDPFTADQVSYFGRQSQDYINRLHGGPASKAYLAYLAYYFALVGLGLFFFYLNRKRFSVSRFLIFAGAAVLWGLQVRYGGEFAIVLAATLGLNGQEWYLNRFGDRGRIDSHWTLWSVGGRLATLGILFLFMVKGLTGYGASPAEAPFRFGYSRDEFAFEASDFLAQAPLEGRVLNLNRGTGDALIWRAWPKNPQRLTFIDGRDGVFGPQDRIRLEELRRALRDGQSEVWKPILDQYGISTIMVPMAAYQESNRTYDNLLKDDRWIPFYDDGGIVLFGRADAPANDLAFFQERRLEPRLQAYRTARRVPSSDQIPGGASLWFDRIFQNQFARVVQPHVWAAQRWLAPPDAEFVDTDDPARALLAVGEARSALAKNPDDPAAWRILAQAYNFLAISESKILTGGAPDVGIPADYALFRAQQRAAALNYAIRSSPPPPTEDAKRALGFLHAQLAELFLDISTLDLALENLKKARDLLPEEQFAAVMASLTTTDSPLSSLLALEEQVEAVRGQIEQLSLDPQSTPIDRAQFAIDHGMMGLAIQQYKEAESYNINVAAVKAPLIDLYCRTGQPDLAFELFSAGNVEDAALMTAPGAASYRQALVYFLIGGYDVAGTLWKDRSLPQVRLAVAYQALDSSLGMLHWADTSVRRPDQGAPEGQPWDFINSLLALPGLDSLRPWWEAQVGLCLLEAGVPEEAAAHLESSLILAPDQALRPLLAFYLERMGRPVPPPSTKTSPDSLPENVFATE